MISNVFKCVSICFEFASTAEWQQLTHWVNTKAGIKFQNHSKQSLWFFVHKKELHIARNSISANKKVGKTVNYLDAVFYITKRPLRWVLLNCANYIMYLCRFFFSFFTRDMYPWLYPLIDEAMFSKCSLAKTTSPLYIFLLYLTLSL